MSECFHYVPRYNDKKQALLKVLNAINAEYLVDIIMGYLSKYEIMEITSTNTKDGYKAYCHSSCFDYGYHNNKPPCHVWMNTLMRNQHKEVKIVVMGSCGVGKSNLTIKFVTGNFLEDYDPTIEDNYHKKLNIHGKNIIFNILDTAGREEYSAMTDQWIREGQFFLVLFSCVSQSSYQDALL